MEHITYYINEKLKLDKNIKYDSYSYEFDAFKSYYKGLPNNIAKNIFDKYVRTSPFSEEANNVRIATAFELLFMIGAILVEDNETIDTYNQLGYKKYKIKHPNGNNPYDWGWFDEELSSGQDFLTYLQNDWIPDNYDEFKQIYNWCKEYKNILSIDKIEGFCENVEEI